MELIKVKLLRDDKFLASHVNTQPGIYRVWCSDDGVEKLLNNQNLLKKKELSCMTINIDDKVYHSVYLGISDNLQRRLKDHIYDQHNKPNYLSTLRKTISVLISNKKILDTVDEVNDFMDTHCYVEFFYTGCKLSAEILEKLMLSKMSKYSQF